MNIGTQQIRETEAVQALDRGWVLTPLNGKKPILTEWEKRPRPSVDQVMKWARENNIGIRTGTLSGIVVIDCDPGSDISALDLPKTVTSITGRDGRHFYFRANGTHIGNSVGKLASHVDVKADKGQVVAVGSIHPDTGSIYRWAPGLSPAEVPLADLPAHIAAKLAPKPKTKPKAAPAPKAGSRYAQAALDAELETVRQTPSGRGNDQLNCSAFALGQLVGAGPLNEVSVIEALVDVATPRRSEAEARSTIQSGIDAGKREPREIMERKTPTTPKPDNRRTTITISTDIPVIVDAAVEALAWNAHGVFQRGHTLVHIVRNIGRPLTWLRRPEGAAMIAELGEAGTLEQLASVADWKAAKDGKPALPPKWTVNCLLARKQWTKIRHLEGIVTAPTLRPDGTFLDTPGYDSKTGLLFEPGNVSFPSLPLHPTQEQAQAAIQDLIDPFRDFPFVDPAGLSAVVAAILTILGRYAITGPCPLHAARSTTPGSGKGLIVDVICIITTGRTPARTTAPKGKDADSEWRKRILALALEGDSAILIDNIDGQLGSPTLASMLTANEIKDRLLGVSRTVEAPLRAVWFATGNGLTFRGDLGRRVIPIDLDPKVEHPEDRTGPEPGRSWAHPDLLAYIHEHRPRLVVAGLTILRAFHLAGRPAHGKPLKGSFEAWDAFIRAAVIWAGGADPLDACVTVRQEGDADLDVLRSALTCWRESFPEPITVSAAVTEAKRREDRELLTALANLSNRDEGKLDGRSLGYALRRLQGRIANGLRFQKAGSDLHDKITKWRVEGCG